MHTGSNEASLSGLVVRLMAPYRPSAEDRARFAGDDRVRNAYFVLDDAPENVERFLTDTLPRLLPRLARRTAAQSVELVGRTRGPVLWPQTFALRSRRGAPGHFTCREKRERFNLPENQLLKHLLGELRTAIGAIPRAVATGWSVTPARSESRAFSTAARLDAMARVLDLAARDRHLEEVTPPERISDALLAVAAHQNKDYAPLARLYHRCATRERANDWAALAASSRRVLLLPGTSDEESEYWYRLAATLLLDRPEALTQPERASGGEAAGRP